MSDWIDSFMDYTEGIPSPRIFRLWSAIGAVGGALERRVWITSAGQILFPNMYILLVGSPGSGKTQSLDHVQSLWSQVPDLHLAADNSTKAALVDALGEAKRTLLVAGKLVEYHSLLICAGELGVFMPAHDLEMMSTLVKLYDNPQSHKERRRHEKVHVNIYRPQLHFVAGVQPGFLAELLPEAAWAMGFTSRLVMVYSSSEVTVDPFAPVNLSRHKEKPLVEGLKRMSAQYGEFLFTKETEQAISSWVIAKMPPRPIHTKLQHYSQRRILHLLKLCTISAASRGPDHLITIEDYQRAQGWLLEAEELMPDVFREMVQRSDSQVMQELHYFAQQQYFANKRQPLPGSLLVDFLSNRTASEKVLRLLDLCVRSGMFLKAEGLDLYTPRPYKGIGVE